MTPRRRALFALLAAGAAGAVLVAGMFRRDMGRAYARVAGRSELVATPVGPVEFAAGGAGTPVLVVHGSGGGFDQGELIAQAVLGEGLRWIAPSRFGYLRSPVPAGASFETQAQAYAGLLDALGLGRVAVVALSHGGPSALLFALQHPDRVSSLTLISCGVTALLAPGQAPDQARSDRQGAMLAAIFRHDVLYWALSRFGRRPLMRLMGASDEVARGLSAPQRMLVDRVIDGMNPVGPRSAGAAFDHAAALPDARIAGIRAPTLIFHASDDTLQRVRHAEFAAATIPGARLRRFERGGHLLVAVEQPTIRAETTAFILAHAGA